MSALTMIGIGFVCVVLGVAIPLLMMLDILATGYVLSLLALAVSVAGVFLGIIGASLYVRQNR